MCRSLFFCFNVCFSSSVSYNANEDVVLTFLINLTFDPSGTFTYSFYPGWLLVSESSVRVFTSLPLKCSLVVLGRCWRRLWVKASILAFVAAWVLKTSICFLSALLWLDNYINSFLCCSFSSWLFLYFQAFISWYCFFFYSTYHLTLVISFSMIYACVAGLIL